MCWYNYNINGTKSNDKPVCHIAETDIEVYKVMLLKNGFLRSYFQCAYYEKSKTYSLHRDEKMLVVGYAPSKNSYVITEGFHSYDAGKCHLKTTKSGNVTVMRGSIPIQLYAVKDMVYSYIVLARCVIPKGTNYYENGIGEVVSDRIIIKNYGFLNNLCLYVAENVIKFDDVPMLFSES